MSMPSFEESSRVRRRGRPTTKIFDLPMARATLPLVRRILSDVVARHARIAHLKLDMERRRGGGTWEEAKAGHRVADELSVQKVGLRDLLAEMAALGVELLDPLHGFAGFPTIVNGSLAYLVHRSSDEDILYWRYRDQDKLRPIPVSWYSDAFVQPEPSGLLA